MAETALRRTPLYDEHRRLGAKMVPFAGYEMPIQYSGIVAEHRAVRSRAGLFDLSHMGEFHFRGRGAQATVDRLVSSDVAGLDVGQARYGLLCNERGTIVDDVIVYRVAVDELMMVVNAANIAKDRAHVLELLGADTAFEDRSTGTALIAIQGPRAAQILSAESGAEVTRLHPFGVIGARLARTSAVVARTGYTGEDGFEVFVASEGAGAVWSALREAGREADLLPIGLGARDTLRLEARYSLYGNEIDESTDPIEAGLAWTIGKRRRAEAGFPGAAMILRQLAEGTARKRVGIRPDGRAPAREGTTVVDPVGNRIGAVTSGGFGPSLGAPIAMGYVDAAHAAEGSALSLIVREIARPAHVSRLPFVPTRYYRPTGASA